MSKKNFDLHEVLGFSPEQKDNPNSSTEESATAVPASGEAEQSTFKIEPKPNGCKLNAKWVKLRSHRLQLLITEDLAQALKKQAKKNDVSVNELCNQVLESFIIK